MGGGHGVNGRSRKQDTDDMGTWRRAGREHWQASMGTPSVGRQVKTSQPTPAQDPSAMTNGSTGQEIWNMSVPAGRVSFKAGKPCTPWPDWRIPPACQSHSGVAAVARKTMVM